MATIDYPLINGVRHDFSSVRFKLRGVPVTGISAVNYSARKEPGKVYGTSSRLLGKTPGVVDFSASVTVYENEWAYITAALAIPSAAGAAGLMTESFDIIVQYVTGNASLTTDTLVGCTITEIGASHSQGNSPLVRQITLQPMNIKFNGANVLNEAQLTPLNFILPSPGQ